MPHAGERTIFWDSSGAYVTQRQASFGRRQVILNSIHTRSEGRVHEGCIVRQRTKTRRHEHPPVVNYKLWPRTARLLRSQLSAHQELALTNRAGAPLCVSKLVVKNGTARETVFSSLLRRYLNLKKAKPQMPNKQMKYLRKTGSSRLRSDRRFLSLDSLYLGHSWVGPSSPSRRRALAQACLAKLGSVGIRKCHIFLFADNEAGEDFWKQIGWKERPDLKVLQKATATEML